MCTHIAFAHVCIHYTHARVHMYTPLHMRMLTYSHTCFSPHTPMPTRAHTHPARMSWLWPSGPAAATPHGPSPLPPHHTGQGRPPHAFSRWAVFPRLLPTGAAGKYCPFAASLQGRNSPKVTAGSRDQEAFGAKGFGSTPVPPVFFLPSCLPVPSCLHLLRHHHDPCLASYPDMLFPLRSLHPAKNLVSSHLGLRADALISFQEQSPLCGPAGQPVWVAPVGLTL